MSRVRDLWEQVVYEACVTAATGPDKQEIEDYSLEQRENSEAWIMSDSEEPGSFLWVCDWLELDAADIRARVQAKIESRNA